MTITIIIASVLAYFLIGILAFCWEIRNVLLNSGRPKLYDDNPSYWFDWLDSGGHSFLFCNGHVLAYYFSNWSYYNYSRMAMETSVSQNHN